ncbi:MAG: hypothetical protein RLZZ15_2347 [Verrucomicrobiota bacterium]|jgi:hypothetical protein
MKLSARLGLWVAGVALAASVLGGCRSAPLNYVPATARFYLESSDAGARGVTLPRSGVRLAIGAAPVLSEGDILNVEIAQVELGRCLMFQLTTSAARDLYRYSASNQGRRLVLLVDGAALGARRVEAPLNDGTLFVFVEIPDDQLPGLVERVKQTSADLQRALAKKR